MRLLTLPLYQYDELSETARADALQAIRDERISIFVKHELPELVEEINTLAHAYGFIVLGRRLHPFSERNHVVIMRTGRGKDQAARLSQAYDGSNTEEHFKKEVTFQEALSDYMLEHGPPGYTNFTDFFRKMLTYAWKTRLACVENSIDSEHDSIRFADEMEYEFTERGAIFEH